MGLSSFPVASINIQGKRPLERLHGGFLRKVEEQVLDTCIFTSVKLHSRNKMYRYWKDGRSFVFCLFCFVVLVNDYILNNQMENQRNKWSSIMGGTACNTCKKIGGFLCASNNLFKNIFIHFVRTVKNVKYLGKDSLRSMW